ncbi:MAG TPA: TetR/AcrR family transcriptional regulator [Casimicrobiaceae bacterium]|nr:TetR/AcrR family transcriptional regulator [Casimicrobiaceae bacterium]
MARRTPAARRARKPAPRTYDAARTREDILSVATREFARDGFNGARVDAIAARTSTTKRMIYYYFGGKEQLYIAVLEAAYARIREAEAALQLDRMEPEAAIRHLVQFTFDYDHANPDFVRLVAVENIHHARHLAKSTRIRKINAGIIATIDEILRRGRRAGTFHARVSAIDVHMLMSALCFFHVSNLHTFGRIFRRDFLSPKLRQAHRKLAADFIIHLLTVS